MKLRLLGCLGDILAKPCCLALNFDQFAELGPLEFSDGLLPRLYNGGKGGFGFVGAAFLHRELLLRFHKRLKDFEIVHL